MAAAPKSPPPPLLFLGCLATGWALGRLKPLPLHLPGSLRVGLGALLILVAATLGSWGLLTFWRHQTTPEPNGEAKALLTSGPFSFTRNPLYLGLASLLTGFGLLLESAWILFLVPVLVLLLDRFVIRREEARLAAQFGEVYQSYLRRVRRWF
jgi:protein-S-isoprenylcysteine O-methyltransferase Ste14